MNGRWSPTLCRLPVLFTNMVQGIPYGVSKLCMYQGHFCRTNLPNQHYTTLKDDEIITLSAYIQPDEADLMEHNDRIYDPTPNLDTDLHVQDKYNNAWLPTLDNIYTRTNAQFHDFRKPLRLGPAKHAAMA
jgi:hypothetical protein